MLFKLFLLWQMNTFCGCFCCLVCVRFLLQIQTQSLLQTFDHQRSHQSDMKTWHFFINIVSTFERYFVFLLLLKIRIRQCYSATNGKFVSRSGSLQKPKIWQNGLFCFGKYTLHNSVQRKSLWEAFSWRNRCFQTKKIEFVLVFQMKLLQQLTARAIYE